MHGMYVCMYALYACVHVSNTYMCGMHVCMMCVVCSMYIMYGCRVSYLCIYIYITYDIAVACMHCMYGVYAYMYGIYIYIYMECMNAFHVWYVYMCMCHHVCMYAYETSYIYICICV